MDELYELIDSRIKKAQDDTSLHSVPCVVLDVLNNGYVEVQPIGREVTYKVLNYSGTDIFRGDNVILFYTGNVLSNNGFIGASFYRPNTTLTTWQPHPGSLSKGAGAVALSFVEVEKYTNIICNLTLVVSGEDVVGDIVFGLFVDGVAMRMPTNHTVHPSESNIITVTHVVSLGQGVHEIYLYTTGVGKVNLAEGYLSGAGFHSPRTPQTPTVPFLTP